MHRKIPLIVFFASFLLLAAVLIHVISTVVVSRGVNILELRQAQTDMTQLYSLLGASALRLHRHAYDWSHGDDIYAYMEDKNENFLATHFGAERLRELHVSGAAMYTTNAQRITFIDGTGLAFGQEWLEQEAQVFDSVAKLVHTGYLGYFEGFINVGDVGMMVAAHRIHDATGRKPFRGYLLMAIALDGQFLERSRSVSGLHFNILPLNVFKRISATSTHGDNFKFLQTEEDVRVYSTIHDIFGVSSFCLETRRPRNIAAFGGEISRRNSWLMFLLCLAVLGAGLLMLHMAHQRFAREQMHYSERHDSLTGLPNSLLLVERLANIGRTAQADGQALGVIYMDLDNFKSVNNCYGYQQGDAVLRETAQRLRGLTASLLVARSGVDNFQIALMAENQEHVEKQAQSILEAMNKPFAVRGNRLHIGVSMGLAFLGHCQDGLALVHKAELAMYDAKERGGNALSVYDVSMDVMASARKRLETALYEAVEHNALSVQYQPKIDIAKNTVAGCEALVRWQVSDGAWIPPSDFIPIAEETGLVTRIDFFVLRTACRQALAWHEDGAGSVPIAVNMSVRSILSEGFADQVIGILEEEGVSPSLIDIEITETSFMSNMETAFAAISRLHEAGLRIALDDFGTGYSSLQYLSAMPISFLKIDKKFVDDIFSGKVTAQPLVKSILSLAASLGMHTISEGVEKLRQLEFLADNGAHIIQGFLFSRPLTAADCGEFLRNGKARIAAAMHTA